MKSRTEEESAFLISDLAEKAVLGSLMLEPTTFDYVVELLTEDDFNRHEHKLVYRAILESANRGVPFDAVTLSAWFYSQGLSELIKDGAYLVEITAATPNAMHTRAYTKVVRDMSVLRQIRNAASTIVETSLHPSGCDSEEILTNAEITICGIADASQRVSAYPIMSALAEAFEVVRSRYEAGGDIEGLSTGFHDLDEMTSGLQPASLIVLGARPAMGKTTLALSMVRNVALNSKKAVAIFSMEMSASQLALRLLSAEGRINAKSLRTGALDDKEWKRLSGAVKNMRDAKIFIGNSSSVRRITAEARRIKREHGLDLIVIDYLQLIHMSPGKDRAAEIGEIMHSLKALAKVLNVPVVVLSQLSRSLERRKDKRPTMADLRETGLIEEAADTIIFIYREDYYFKDISADKSLAEIIIGKQRNGPTGCVKLKFSGEYSRFYNLSYDSAGEIE